MKVRRKFCDEEKWEWKKTDSQCFWGREENVVTEQYLKPFLASLILSINSEITHEKKRCEWGGSANSYESSLLEFGELCALGFEVTDVVMENKKTKTVTFQLRWCDLPPAVSVLPYDVMYLSLGQWVVIFNKKGSYIAYVSLKNYFNFVLNYMS